MKLLNVSNLLEVVPLVKFLCKVVANKLKVLVENGDIEGARKIFNIKNDYTPDEEKKLDKEIKWILE